MKKLILAGIIIIICCLVFLIVRQNSSRADIDLDLYKKPYPVPFGDWVLVYLRSVYSECNDTNYHLGVKEDVIEGKIRFRIYGNYDLNTELGKLWYQKAFPKVKESIRKKCLAWTQEGYPISFNDFEFDVSPYF